MKLTPAFSSYLDCLRFSAALVVLLSHLTQDGFALGWLPVSQLGHEAVVVFFVMSGYIITASTVASGRGAADYVVARASRIYSVALPTVVFCALLAWVVEYWMPALKPELPSWRTVAWPDMAASLLFLNESWGSPSDLTLNGPYWSLCYEVWYYVLFGLALFVRGPWRWPLLVLAAAIAGPAIVVLFPIWLLGAWLATTKRTLPKAGPAVAFGVWVGSMLLIWLIDESGIDQFIKSWLHNRVPGFWRLEASQQMWTDYAAGLLVAAHLWAFTQLPAAVRSWFERHGRFWSALAAFSFTLYLFHRPMTSLAGALTPASMQTVPIALVALGAVLGACWLISFATERRLPQWRRLMRRLMPRPAPAAT